LPITLQSTVGGFTSEFMRKPAHARQRHVGPVSRFFRWMARPI
jgi:hypothetical protein